MACARHQHTGFINNCLSGRSCLSRMEDTSLLGCSIHQRILQAFWRFNPSRSSVSCLATFNHPLTSTKQRGRKIYIQSYFFSSCAGFCFWRLVFLLIAIAPTLAANDLTDSSHWLSLPVHKCFTITVPPCSLFTWY
jgi:hypothetical protein